MKMNKSTAFVIIMALILCAYVFVLLIYARKAPVPPEEEEPAEVVEEPRIYSIPENVIPPVKEIEKAIKKTREEKEEEERELKHKITAALLYSENQRKPEEKDKSPKPQTTVVIPTKKEVKFPTYEERKASNSQGSVCVY